MRTMGSSEHNGRPTPRVARLRILGIAIFLISTVVFVGVWHAYPMGIDEAKAHATTVLGAMVSPCFSHSACN